MNHNQLIRMQISSASVSFVASSFIAIAIIRSDGGLTSPYRRIIFGLSVSDILQSFALFTGPFVVPSALPQGIAIWAIGNDFTCRFNGVMYTIGSCSTSMYMFALCLYSVMKTKKRSRRRTSCCRGRRAGDRPTIFMTMPMTDQDFVRNIEKFIHPSIILFTATLCIAGLVTKSINSTVLGNICTFSAIPAGCRQRPDIFGECDPDIARSTAILVYISVIGLEVSCLLGIISCMTTICCHILKTFKIERALPLPVLPAPPATLVVGNGNGINGNGNGLRPSRNSAALVLVTASSRSSTTTPPAAYVNVGLELQLSSTNSGGDSSVSQKIAGSENKKDEEERSQQEATQQQHRRESVAQQSHTNSQDSTEKIRLYRNEIMLQACWFVTAYFVTFVCRWIVYIYYLSEFTPPMGFIWISSVLYPLGGFFNVFVYSRPKVAAFRIRNPEYSWCRAFWLVIKAGNDAPKVDQNLLASNADAAMNNNSTAAAPRSILVFLHRPKLMTSDVGGVYNGSESIENDDIAYRSEVQWQHNVGGLKSGLGIIVEGEVDEESQEFEQSSVDLDFSRQESLSAVEEEDQLSLVVNPVDKALARAMERIKALEKK